MPEQLDLRPAPGGAPPARRWWAHTGAEWRMLMTNGEQLLLTVVIPVAALVVVVQMGLGTLAATVPGVLSLCVLSSAFAALAISTGFERRAGVLKFLGATPLGRSGLLVGKVGATLAVITVQWLLVLTTALVLGWSAAGVNWALVVLLGLLGTAALGTWGFALAGLLRAEATLAVANGIFLLLMFAGGTVLPPQRLPGFLAALAAPLPTNALSDGLRAAMGLVPLGGFPTRDVALLAIWAAAGAALAGRTFRWE